jgi:hypothetical protein
MAQSLMCRGAGEEKTSHPEKPQIPTRVWTLDENLSVISL